MPGHQLSRRQSTAQIFLPPRLCPLLLCNWRFYGKLFSHEVWHGMAALCSGPLVVRLQQQGASSPLGKEHSLILKPRWEWHSLAELQIKAALATSGKKGKSAFSDSSRGKAERRWGFKHSFRAPNADLAGWVELVPEDKGPGKMPGILALRCHKASASFPFLENLFILRLLKNSSGQFSKTHHH